MLNKAQNVILLLCLTSLVYILRDTNASPTGFLQKQIIRYLQDEKPSDTLCSGVDLNEEITVSQRERADSYRSALSTIRNGNRFVEFIEGPAPAGDFGKDYIVSVIKYAIPWIVFFAISVIGCLIFLFSWCCCRHSKSDRFKNCYMILGLLFLVFVAGAAIAGIVVSRSIPKGGHRTVCNSALLYEKLADGNTTENWIGIRPAADQIVVTLDSFSETVDNLDQLNDNFRQLDTSLQPALNAVAAMYNDNRDKVVQTRPNPDIAGGYTPDIINNLGPLDNPGSVTGALQVEMQTKKDVVEQAGQAIDTGVTTLKQNKQQYQADLDAGRNFAVETSNSVGEAYNKVLEFGTDANRIIDGINGALLGIFIAKLAIAAFAVLSILIVCCGAQFFNKCVHLSWCALGLIVILTWALSAVVFPLSLVLFEGCQVADKVITEPAFYNQTYDKFIGTDDSNTQKGKEVIYQCLFGDGDILAVFGLANNKINMFDPIFNALDNTANLTEAVQAVPNSIIIPIDQQLIDSMRQGTVPDSSVTVQDLGTLNEYIIRNGPQCTQNRDYWVLDASQCTTGTGTVFTIQNAAGFNMGNPTCIPLNAFLDKNINDRYTATTLPQGTCGTSDEDLSRFVDNFVQSRQEVNGILDDLSTSLAAVSSANDDFMASLKDVTQSFDPIRSDTLTIYNALANKDTGLLNNANCTFIKGSIENIRDSLCVVTVSGIFQTTIDIIVLSFMGLFATLFVFCLSRKFSVIEKEGKRMPAEAYKLPKV